MRSVLLPVMLLSSGVALATNAEDTNSSNNYVSYSNNGYGDHASALTFAAENRCSQVLTIWRPAHPRACPSTVTWGEVLPGLSIGVATQAFDRPNRVMYSDISVKNETGLSIAAGSKLIFANSSLPLLNAEGQTEAGQPYLVTTQDLPSGQTVTLRAEFKPRLRPLSFDAGFDILQVSDGVVSIAGEARVVRTLTANVSDPAGVSSAVSYQWQADGVDIAGATSATYKLTAEDESKIITVTASYIDDAGFAENIQSNATTAVAARNENTEGSLQIQGERLAGATLRAVLGDNNGIAGNATYHWYVDGQAIEGATESILYLGSELVGKTITATANYTDYDEYSESPSATTSHIATSIVSSEQELVAALASASNGEWIALASGEYANMAEIAIANGITLTAGQDGDAVISGATCIELSGNQSGLVGLTFDGLSPLFGSACDDNNKLNSVWVSGDNVTVSHNRFLGHAEDLGSVAEYNYVYLRGSYNVIERNLFSGKNLDIKGAAVSVYNKGDGSEGGHVVQYNLFKDMPGTSVQSSAYALQVGRSTGSDGLGEGQHVVRFNRFDNVMADRRIIKVQASRSSVYGNTIVNSTGGISLEDGYENTVSNNVILSAGDNSDDSGIMFSPFGHTVTGNYIAGLKTTSSQRAALLLNTETVANSGNSALSVSRVTVANNTVINSNNAIATYTGSKCVADTFVASFENNLVANGVAGQGSNGADSYAFDNGCAINSLESNFSNETYFASGADLVPLTGSAGEVNLVVTANGLLSDANSLAGANASALIVLSELDVGPGSSFVQPVAGAYNGALNLDFTHWYITFPTGDAQYNPQWLLDGNTSENEFYYDADGAAVFKTPNIAGTTSANTKYSRTELREMMRGPEQSPKPAGWPSTQGINKNNWVFSNSYQRVQYEAGGVDGVMEATLKVDHVSTTVTEGYEYMMGRVIVGQIHASDDEPFRLYYRKLPGNSLGSVYFATEVPGLGDNRYDMIGDSKEDSPNPVDGIALGEVWSYRVEAKGDDLTVTIMREGKPDVTRTVKTAAAYANDWMYFKAGVYNQNNGGDPSDYAQATFYSIVVSHDAPPAEPGNGEDEGNGGTTTEVTDGPSLQTAILAASAGDTIEIGAGDYANMGTVVVTDGVTITRAEGSNAVISGEFCLQVSGDGARITGLEFADLIVPADSASHCRSNGDGNIVITGDDVVFDHNLLSGDAEFPTPVDDDYHNWLVLKGSNALVERNTFQNRRGIAADGVSQVRGGFISIYVNGSATGNTVQYNLFKDMLLNDQSTAYAIMLGRTTGLDSMLDGFNTIQYNRFDNIDSKTRVIRVQGSSNTISHNTVVNSQGMLALESGQNNVVSYNVILPSGTDSNDGGISAAPYGHTIVGNYIAGSNTTSSERGAIYLNNDVDEPGNLAATPSAVEIAGNTIINSKQPIHIGAKGCEVGPAFIANFSNNLIANGVSGVSEFYEGAPVSGRAAIRYSCELDPAHSFTGEAYFSDLLYSTSGVYGGGLWFDAASTFGYDGEATLIAGENGLIEATGSLTGKGAPSNSLVVVEETDVGVGSATNF
ncbi:polysaccharide lyase family 7 protein [Saccharophagus degradans]|uniref:polysaccharide lyase family 7 protein n=1 Tax=Saccharophagus degradans TaxID=86304 RepID=UPI002477ED9F|nr:polysaccharide lyase family 7 protein [Saccharophagus degradans]WGO99692.1 polysaccharide lyase family 7 protein [Saccharophagus degradans]